MLGVDEQFRFRQVATVRRVLDDEFRARAMGEEEQRTHARNNIVGAIKIGAVFAGHEATTNALETCADGRWPTVGRRLGFEESGDGECATRRRGDDHGVVTPKYALAQHLVNFVLGDVGRLAASGVRVAVKEVDLDAETSCKLSETIGAVVRAREEEKKLHRVVRPG